jgi:hypothetical protein
MDQNELVRPRAAVTAAPVAQTRLTPLHAYMGKMIYNYEGYPAVVM